MRKTLFALAALLVASTASAAEGAKPMIGLGAAVSFSPDLINITVPINVAPNLRIEPFVGIVYDRTSYDTNVAGALESSTERDFVLGVGGYMVQEAGQQVELYFGGKLGLDFYKLSDKYVSAPSVTSDHTAFTIAAVAGAEYYFSPRFALGVEASLGLRTYKDDVDTRYTNVMTMSVATAKVFFK